MFMALTRNITRWNLRSRTLEVGRRTLVMGVMVKDPTAGPMVQ